MQAAHSFKGAVAALGAKTGYAVALELETMGREARLEGAPSVVEQLERELERATRFLASSGWDTGIPS